MTTEMIVVLLEILPLGLLVIGLFLYETIKERRDQVASEKYFENKIKAYLVNKGCYCVKYFGCTYSTNGTPDILACVNGYFLGIEVKAQNGKPSELQLEKIREIREAGGFAYVVYPSGWENLKSIIEGLILEEFNREEEMILK